MNRQQFRDFIIYSDALVLALLCLIGNAVALIAVLVMILMG